MDIPPLDVLRDKCQSRGIRYQQNMTREQLQILILASEMSSLRITPAAATSLPVGGGGLPPPSDEQQHAIDQFKMGHNILIDSVAGGGKTTFVIHLAKSCPEMRILFMTYNRRLHDETQTRAGDAAVKNLAIYTYHGFCAYCYGGSCYNDAMMKALIESDAEAHEIAYDAIVVDEAQDIIPIYFRLIVRAIQLCTPLRQICFIGDKYQTIYVYNGADSRFLTLARELHSRPFVRCAFRRTFRCTSPMAVFANELIGYERIVSSKGGARVNHVIANIFSEKEIPRLVVGLIKRYGIEGVLILAPSITAKPFAEISNTLSGGYGINMYVPNSDETVVSEESARDKLSMISYCQAKGLERECVIVLSFDASYFVYYAKDSPPNCLTNAQYVAITRARKELYVVQHYRNYPLSFAEHALTRCNKICLHGEHPVAAEHGDPPVLSVCRMIRHKSQETIDRILQIIRPRVLRPAATDAIIEIPLTTKGRGACREDISDITGTALPIAFGMQAGTYRGTQLQLFADIQCKGNFARMVRKYCINTSLNSLEEVTHFAALSDSITSGYEHRLNQIEDWKWIPQEACDRALIRMGEELGSGGRQEVILKARVDDQIIVGIIDWLITREDVDIYYEIKCASELRAEHFLQLIMYAFLAFCEGGRKKEFRLFNVMTGELATIDNVSMETLTMVYRILISDCSTEDISDAEFIQRARTALRS